MSVQHGVEGTAAVGSGTNDSIAKCETPKLQWLQSFGLCPVSGEWWVLERSGGSGESSSGGCSIVEEVDRYCNCEEGRCQEKEGAVHVYTFES